MSTKIFSIHYRWRENGALFEKWEQVETTSKTKAVAYGKSIAAERAPAYAGKYWFMSYEMFPDLQPREAA